MTNENLKSMILEALENENHIFNSYDDSRDNMILLTTSGEVLDEITIYLSFSVLDDGQILVSASCLDFPNFSHNLRAGYEVCNKLNNDEAVVKYVIDDDCDATGDVTVVFNGFGISSGFSGEMALIAATSVAVAADDAYTAFNEAL